MTATLPPDTAAPPEIQNPYCRHGDIHAYCPSSFEQEMFCAAEEREVFIGGAAGPGKSITLVAELSRQVEIPTYRGIYFRRTYPELAQTEDMAIAMYAPHGGVHNVAKHLFTFPSGATIRFAYAEQDRDKYQFQSNAFNVICWDELTQWKTDALYTFLFSRCRPLKVGDGTRCYIRSASNPGGPGHQWVKDRFIGEDSEHAWKSRQIQLPDMDPPEYYYRLYIPATLDSNPLLKVEYESMLAMMPDPEMRRAYRYGDWDIVKGVMFSELRKNLHQMLTVRATPGRSKEISMDWGYDHNAVALWIETDAGVFDAPRSNVYREYLKSEQDPVTFARVVCDRSEGEGIQKATLDSAAWGNNAQNKGPTIAEQMLPTFNAAGIALVPAVKGPGSRVHGAVLLHTYFFTMRSGGPLLRIMDNCPILWRQLTSLARGDPERGEDPEDIAKNQKDDAYDALRYFVQGRPRPSNPTAQDLAEFDSLRALSASDPRSHVAMAVERAIKHKLPLMRDRTPRIKQHQTPWERN